MWLVYQLLQPPLFLGHYMQIILLNEMLSLKQTLQLLCFSHLLQKKEKKAIFSLQQIFWNIFNNCWLNRNGDYQSKNFRSYKSFKKTSNCCSLSICRSSFDSSVMQRIIWLWTASSVSCHSRSSKQLSLSDKFHKLMLVYCTAPTLKGCFTQSTP